MDASRTMIFEMDVRRKAFSVEIVSIPTCTTASCNLYVNFRRRQEENEETKADTLFEEIGSCLAMGMKEYTTKLRPGNSITPSIQNPIANRQESPRGLLAQY
jgi:hypothetical protein